MKKTVLMKTEPTKMRKKYVFVVLGGLCAVLLLAVLGVKVSLRQSAENISVRFTDFHKADAQEVAGFSSYTLDESGMFWGYFTNPAAEDELRAEPTQYRMEDYEPYVITVTIDNQAKFPVVSKRLVGIYSDECVLTKVYFDGVYDGTNIAAGEAKQEQLLIWLNKELSEDQIEQYLKDLQISYDLVGDLSLTKNGYAPKNFTVLGFPGETL